MTFISDGSRTFDKDREIELKSLGGLHVIRFEMITKNGSLYFTGNWSGHHVNPRYNEKSTDNDNENTVIVWNINVNDCLPGFDKNKTLEIIDDAMKSYETRYGIDSINGNRPHHVKCTFLGSIA